MTGVGIAAALAVGLLVIDAPTWTRLIVFPPLAVGFSSLEQVRRKFCVGFAMAGVRNFGKVGITEQRHERRRPRGRPPDRPDHGRVLLGSCRRRDPRLRRRRLNRVAVG